MNSGLHARKVGIYMNHAPKTRDWHSLEIVCIKREFQLSFRILCIYWCLLSPLRWEGRSWKGIQSIFFFTFSLKRSVPSSQNEQAYFGFCFYLRSSPQPPLCLFFPCRSSWVICWHNSVRSLGFVETWTRSPGTQRFSSDKPANTPPADFLHLRHGVFKHCFAKQVGSDSACLLLPVWVREALSPPLTRGLILSVDTLIKNSFWSRESRFFFLP